MCRFKENDYACPVLLQKMPRNTCGVFKFVCDVRRHSFASWRRDARTSAYGTEGRGAVFATDERVGDALEPGGLHDQPEAFVAGEHDAARRRLAAPARPPKTEETAQAVVVSVKVFSVSK